MWSGLFVRAVIALGLRAFVRRIILDGEAKPMSRVEKIEAGIQEISPAELADFRAWFAGFDANAWDKQFESDILAGKLDGLAARALLDHADGSSTKL